MIEQHYKYYFLFIIWLNTEKGVWQIIGDRNTKYICFLVPQQEDINLKFHALGILRGYLYAVTI